MLLKSSMKFVLNQQIHKYAHVNLHCLRTALDPRLSLSLLGKQVALLLLIAHHANSIQNKWTPYNNGIFFFELPQNLFIIVTLNM